MEKQVNQSTGLITLGRVGDPPWLVVELGVEHITIQADGQEPITLDTDEAVQLGNHLVVASWLLHLMNAARDKGQGGSLSSLLGVGDLIDDE